MKPACWSVLLVFASAAAARAEDAARRQVAVRVSPDHVDFRAGDELVARYHTGADLAKPYFWPVNAPGEVPLTRAWPMQQAAGTSRDHPHQKSAWFCHGEVLPEGAGGRPPGKGVHGVDFWSEAPGHGRIVCTHVGEPRLRADRASVLTRNEWRTADGGKILDEDRAIELHDLGASRLLVLDIDLRAAVPMTFGDTKEGSLGVRVNDAMAGPRGRIETAHGRVGEKACWGRHAAWCDYSGTVNGRKVGLAILDDPANPPACWHCRAYGLMAANPFGRSGSGFPAARGRTDLVHLARGEHLKLRYGLLLHSADAREGGVAAAYERFVKPPALVLWPRGAPGAAGDEAADKPTLSVHRPPPEKAVATAVIVCPGGGYGGLADDHEGRQVADWLNARGVTALVLRYRLAPRYRHPAPMQDVQRAVRTARARAAEWGIDPKRVGVWGFSAGGHLASTVATHFDDGHADAPDPVERQGCRPDFLILAYPVITLEPPYTHRGSRDNLLGKQADPKLVGELSNDRRVTARTPPTFLFHTGNDRVVPPENSVLFYLALRKAGVPAELHVYESGPHGVGLAPHDPVLSSWPDRLAAWMESRGLLKR